ncbi:MAG: hypothetical protein QOH88_1553 [Verrucomicrobiota bacterium]
MKSPPCLAAFRRGGLPLFFCLALVIPSLAFAQDAAPVDLSFGPETEQKEDDVRTAQTSAKKNGVFDLRVRYVKVEGRWTDNLALPLRPGDLLTNQKLSAAMAALRDAITSGSNASLGFHSKGEVGVLYLAVSYDTSTGDGTVGVIFRPYYLHLSMVQVGDNVLPIPRSPRPTIFANVPKPLLALNPMIGLSYDRVFGSAISASFGGDLFHLDPGSSFDARQQFELRADGVKSLEESFYRANASLRYSHQRTNSSLEELAFAADYDGVDEPLGNSEHIRHAGEAAFALKLKVGPATHLSISAGYRHADDSFVDGDTSFETNTTAHEQTARLLLDTIPPAIHGFLRAAFWEESGWLDSATYQRFVGRIGYAREITISPNQTIGLEIVAGGGKTLGNTPGYSQFFGGNPRGQFLYDNPNLAALTQMPSGPIIRSLGENEAHLPGGAGLANGGDAFWHLNLNVTFPFRAWSRPLIPDELTDIPDLNGNPMTIKQVLTNQIDFTGPNMLAAVLQKQGLSADEALREARKILNEVSPAARFIINDANLYSIKPLLMVDAAGLSGAGSSETWLAAGGGVQLTVVTAKFEAGYMRTLSGPTFGQKGNAFVRLVFQNLF